MKYTKVTFRNSDNIDLTGTVKDKVLVLVVGTASSFHNYVIVEDKTNLVHVVNPLAIKMICEPEEIKE